MPMRHGAHQANSCAATAIQRVGRFIFRPFLRFWEIEDSVSLVLQLEMRALLLH